MSGRYVVEHGHYVHRVVAARMLGRPLAPGEQVHHRNGDRGDNRPENLSVVTTCEHAELHTPVTDLEIRDLLLLGHTGRALSRRHIWQQRVNKIKHEMVAEGLRPLLERASAVYGNPRRPFRAVTHCKHGHEFTAASTYVRPKSGKRTCRICLNSWKRADRRRRRLQ